VLPPPAPPPPEKITPHPIRSTKPEGAASPANLRSKATEIVAPVPIVQVTVPPPDRRRAQARHRHPGLDRRGRCPRPRHRRRRRRKRHRQRPCGQWRRRRRRRNTPKRLIRGRLKDSDYPRAAKDALVSGTVSVRYVVAVSGRVTDCTVTTSSGNAELDETTCRLIKDRFRFKPSKDEDGTPVDSIIVENHSWLIDETPEPTPAPKP
jgi:protein TonB